jgi:hypothetical protein
VLAAAAIALTAIAVLAWLIGAPLLRDRRRRAAMRRPLPPGLRAHIERNLPLRARLPAALAARHDALVGAFLDEKEFIGCDGLEVTDEIRATIAAHACLLVLGRRGHYDQLHSVLVYPTGFWVEDEVEDDAGVVERRRRDLSGEAWEASRIILSWEDVLEATHRPGEGYNVAVHEFAHYLEVEGLGLAAPPAGNPGARPRPLEAWSADLSGEFDAMQAAVDRGEDTFLDPYAAEDETEFFAVATEEYFDRPAELREAHPRLYALLAEFYGIDPAAW